MNLNLETGPEGRFPKSFEWHGVRQVVISIGRHRIVDDELFMLIMANEDNIFELAFHRLEQTWRVHRTPRDFGKRRFV
ncbi:MAG: hypothetical protein IIC78_02010 [Chloroflexi bacterium]|nr:hypothetical protein [Chloroflexota bacterium]